MEPLLLFRPLGADLVVESLLNGLLVVGLLALHQQTLADLGESLKLFLLFPTRLLSFVFLFIGISEVIVYYVQE